MNGREIKVVIIWMFLGSALGIGLIATVSVHEMWNGGTLRTIPIDTYAWYAFIGALVGLAIMLLIKETIECVMYEG
jgi:hypothetical protein